MPVSDARAKLPQLLKRVQGKRSFVLTQRGSPKAVLVGLELWSEVMRRLREAYQTTYIDPKLLKYTREFSDKEIGQWLKEDQI